MILCKIVGGVFVNVKEFYSYDYSDHVFFIAEDASLIVLRNGNYYINFHFACEVPNCDKCSWKNIC